MVVNGVSEFILKCIIVGFGNLVYKRDDGVFIVLINVLKD